MLRILLKIWRTPQTQSCFHLLGEKIGNCRWKHNKGLIDYSLYPTLKEEELEENLVRGSGPGRQAVNKTSNAVQLRHIPTNIVVKCHVYRITSRNRDEARKMLLEKLDLLYNGEQSVQAQIKRLESKKKLDKKRRQQKVHAMKEKWKERERIEQENNFKKFI